MEFLRLEASEKARRKVVLTHASTSVERLVGVLLLLAGALGIHVCLWFFAIRTFLAKDLDHQDSDFIG